MKEKKFNGKPMSHWENESFWNGAWNVESYSAAVGTDIHMCVEGAPDRGTWLATVRICGELVVNQDGLGEDEAKDLAMSFVRAWLAKHVHAFLTLEDSK